MSSICRYVIPIVGNVTADKPLPFHIDDLLIEFGTRDDELAALSIFFPIADATKEERAAHANDSFWVHEPRAFEIEEIVLQIASGFSMFLSAAVEIPFELRRIEFFEKDGREPSTVVDLSATGGGLGSERKLALPALIRSVLTACINRRHDPALTFYQRGAADALAHRYIEAFYNFFLFLEYLFGNGKSGKKQTIVELSKQQALTETIEKVMREKKFATIVSADFLSKVGQMSTEELITEIVNLRGHLHHPNKNRNSNWHPERQREFAEEATLLHFICLEIATARYLKVAFSASVESGYKKAQHCVRRGGEIRVVTR